VSISVVVFCLFLLLFSFVGLFVGSVASVSLRVIGKQAYRIILDYNRHDWLGEWLFFYVMLIVYYYFASAAVTVDCSHMTASSSASWNRFSLPSDVVNGHVSTVWFMVCRWPQSQEGNWARPHLCKLARYLCKSGNGQSTAVCWQTNCGRRLCGVVSCRSVCVCVCVS